MSSIAKAVMDKLQFAYCSSVFSRNWFASLYWNPVLSHRNKYKTVTTILIINGVATYQIKQVPKFFGATTFLVWTTDAWHLFQMIFLSSLFALVLFYENICFFDNYFVNLVINYSLIRIIFGGIFELFYKYILTRSVYERPI